MKLAVLSESSADEAAVRILVEGLLGAETEPVGLRLRSRGWPSVLQVLPNVIPHLHYHTDADALVVAADSNRSPFHNAALEKPCDQPDKCRLCRLRSAVGRTLVGLRPVAGRKPLKVAVGLAVPAVEAWYLCGALPGVSETAWWNGEQRGKYPYSGNQLKHKVYGTDRPSLVLETEHAVAHARRLVAELQHLEERFPIGFGALAAAVRAW